MSLVSTSVSERAVIGGISDPSPDAVIDLRDGLESMRGIVAAMALSAPVWIGVAVIARWARHRYVG